MHTRRDLIRMLGFSLNSALAEGARDTLISRYASLTQDDWLRLVQLADTTMLLPALYLSLGRLDVRGHMPGPLREASEAAWRLNQERNGALLNEIRVVSERLAEIDVPAVFIKGAAHLLTALHGDQGARMTLDLDILVPDDQADLAQQYLSGWGTSETGAADTEDDAPVIRNFAAHHLPALRLPGWRSPIELHYGLGFPARTWPTETEILATAKDVEAYPGCRVPHLDHALAVSVSHSFLRSCFFPGAHVHLKDVWDFVALCQSGADFEQLLAAAGTRRQRRAIWAMAHLSEVFFGYHVPLSKTRHLTYMERISQKLAEHFLADNRGSLRRMAPLLWLAEKVGLRVLFRIVTRQGYRKQLAYFLFDRRYR